MEILGTVLAVAIVALLWTAAVVFAHDSRDGRDGFPGSPHRRSPTRWE